MRKMRKPGDDKVVSIVLAIEEQALSQQTGWRGMAHLAMEAARVIRGLRPDLAFKETDAHG